jgi:hypothetical protein
MAKLTSQLYKAARLSNTLGALTSGDSRRAGRRAKNIGVGRLLARGGFWRWLWGGK